AALRVEWTKARARALRWWEEVVLLDEEMRRAIAYCHWQADWWVAQAPCYVTNVQSLREGLFAYSAEQAAANRALAAGWSRQWAAVRDKARDIIDS
ncbi:hypothetical protein CERSUDRAFT_25832, partial [Gelatoporia subvermispora B]